jgi:hypothetical protein
MLKDSKDIRQISCVLHGLSQGPRVFLYLIEGKVGHLAYDIGDAHNLNLCGHGSSINLKLSQRLQGILHQILDGGFGIRIP